MTDADQVPGTCLENTRPGRWMHLFDALPPALRRRVAESPFNLCAACLQLFGGDEGAVELLEEKVRRRLGRRPEGDLG